MFQAELRGHKLATTQAYAPASLVDILDRILDKGLVIDAFVRISVIGLELITIEARIVVASVETYLRFANAIGMTQMASKPPERQFSLGHGQDGKGLQLGSVLQGATQELAGQDQNQNQNQNSNQPQALPQNGGQQGNGQQDALTAELRRLLDQLQSQQGQGQQQPYTNGQRQPVMAGR